MHEILVWIGAGDPTKRGSPDPGHCISAKDIKAAARMSFRWGREDRRTDVQQFFNIRVTDCDCADTADLLDFLFVGDADDELEISYYRRWTLRPELVAQMRAADRRNRNVIEMTEADLRLDLIDRTVTHPLGRYRDHPKQIERRRLSRGGR